MTAVKPIIAPYRVESSGKGLAHVMARTNRLNFGAYGAGGCGDERPCAEMRPILEYEQFLQALRAHDHIDCISLRELIRQPSATGRLRLAIRHDIDSDVVAALEQARIEHAFGIRTSYYVLHTAPYYGFMDNGVFYRHKCMAEIYRRIQELGHEIGLHTDPLMMYQDWKVDGAAAVVEELAWLRANGLNVSGTLAHNSIGAYGASSYSIFKGRPLSLIQPECPNEVENNGKWTPLQVLDERELGLEYEGNDIFWQGAASVRYVCAYNDARWWWEGEKSVPRLKARGMLWESSMMLDSDELVSSLAANGFGGCAVVVVHPEHFGLRHSRLSGPVRRLSHCEMAPSTKLGWFGYRPGSLLARHGAFGDTAEFQTITAVSGSGMLDRPGRHPAAVDADPLKVAWFGGTNSDGSAVHAALQTSERLRLTKIGERSVALWKYAFHGMGITRLCGWYDAVAAEIRPNLVVIGIGADELQRSLPANWSRATGVDPSRPAGGFLDVENGEAIVRPASAAASLYFRPPQPIDDRRSLADLDLADTPELRRDFDYLATTLGCFIDRVRADGAKPILLIEECGESLGLSRSDSDVGRRSAGHACFRQRLDALLGGRIAAIADPYPPFMDSKHPTHWRSCPEWNVAGHRLAATVLADTITGVQDVMSANTQVVSCQRAMTLTHKEILRNSADS